MGAALGRQPQAVLHEGVGVGVVRQGLEVVMGEHLELA